MTLIFSVLLFAKHRRALRLGTLGAAMLLASTGGAAFAATQHDRISVRDDKNLEVSVLRPAQRIVVLTPHATELVFAAGGGTRIVGAVSHSDYPVAARAIPRVGDYARLDIERIIALKPDLIVAWSSGNPARQLMPLQQLGIPVFFSEPRQLAQIPSNIERLGQLMATSKVAQPLAKAQRQTLQRLKERYGGRAVVPVFYQVSEAPLYTLNGEHIVSESLRLCSGKNVFAGLKGLAPVVTIEAVLQANPEAIMRGMEAGERVTQKPAVQMKGKKLPKAPLGLEAWQRYSSLLAVQRNNLFTQDADLLSRPGPRMIEGTAQLCQQLELARQRRP